MLFFGGRDMALFNSIPAVSTQKDTTKPIGKKPSSKVTKEDLEVRDPLTEEEEDLILKDRIKELEEEAPEEIYFEDEEELPKEEKKEVKPIEKPKAGEPAKVEKKEEKAPIKPLKVTKAEPKPAPKAEAKAPAKPESKVEVKKPEPKVEPKEEPKVEEKPVKPIVKEEIKEEKQEEDRPLTPEEKKARQMENLRKARLARQAQQAKENDTMATKPQAKEEKPKKLVTETKKPVDMSKMVMTAKPKKEASGKTVYHVSKRGETREDRVWKVFIQESNKVIKLFDYQEEALEYAKQLAKNKNDGSYVILHGLNGKIRKY